MTGSRFVAPYTQVEVAPTGNPYDEAMMVEALRRQYELGRKDGYDEAVKMIKRATDEFKKAKKRA